MPAPTMEPTTMPVQSKQGSFCAIALLPDSPMKEASAEVGRANNSGDRLLDR